MRNICEISMSSFFPFPHRKCHLRGKKNEIDTTMSTPESVMKRVVQWCDKFADGDGNRIRFVSDCVGSDATWVSYYLSLYAQHLPLTVFFGPFHALIDTSSYHQGVSRYDHNKVYSIEQTEGGYSEDKHCREALKIPDTVKPLSDHTHNAIDDAKHILSQHIIILQSMKTK